jgi:hypothetical protein
MRSRTGDLDIANLLSTRHSQVLRLQELSPPLDRLRAAQPSSKLSVNTVWDVSGGRLIVLFSALHASAMLSISVLVIGI